MAMRNALMPFQLPEAASISALTNPLMQGMQTYRQGMAQEFEGNRALAREGMDKRRLQIAEGADARSAESHGIEVQKAKVQQIAGLAQMADQERDPTRRGAIMQRIYGMHPGIADGLKAAGVDPSDYVNVPKFLVAEARGFVDPLTEQAKRQQIAAGAIDLKIKQRELDNPASKLTTIAEGGVLVATDPRTGQHREIARGNDKSQRLPPGYRATADGNMEAVPGGPADIKQNEKRQQDYASATQVIQQLDELAKSVNRVATSKGLDKNFGVQGYVPNIPGGDAANAAALLDTLRTQGAFAALQEMRNASKTGGALGAVSDRENQMLQNAIAALQKAQSAKQVREQLNVLLDHVESSKARIREAYNDHWNRGGEAAKREMTGKPPMVKDESDYNRLPSGAQYVDPEGNVRTKR